MMRRLTLTVKFGALALADLLIVGALLLQGTSKYVVLTALLVLLGLQVFVVSRASKRLERQAAENEHPAGAASAEASARVAEKIASALSKPFMLKGLTLDVEASIGISLYPEHGSDVDTLLQRADVAMYMAKEAHAGYEVYQADRDQYTPKR